MIVNGCNTKGNVMTDSEQFTNEKVWLKFRITRGIFTLTDTEFDGFLAEVEACKEGDLETLRRIDALVRVCDKRNNENNPDQ